MHVMAIRCLNLILFHRLPGTLTRYYLRFKTKKEIEWNHAIKKYNFAQKVKWKNVKIMWMRSKTNLSYFGLGRFRRIQVSIIIILSMQLVIIIWKNTRSNLPGRSENSTDTLITELPKRNRSIKAIVFTNLLIDKSFHKHMTK